MEKDSEMTNEINAGEKKYDPVDKKSTKVVHLIITLLLLLCLSIVSFVFARERVYYEKQLTLLAENEEKLIKEKEALKSQLKNVENSLEFLKSENEEQKKSIEAGLSTCSEGGTTIDYYLTTGFASSYIDNVNKFIADNEIEKKMSLVRKDILKNREFKYEQQERYNECTLTQASAGVPMLYLKKEGEKGKCFMGDQEIIAFFKQELGIN